MQNTTGSEQQTTPVYSGYIAAVKDRNFRKDTMNYRSDLEFVNNDSVIIKLFDDMGEGDYFVEENGGLINELTYWVTVVKTTDKLIAFNGNVVMLVDKNNDQINISIETGVTEDLMHEVFLLIGKDNFTLNHYEYLEIVLDNFWKHVFNKSLKDAWCVGIISAHGDKCYGWKDTWEEAGISFHRGAMLYLLTYTSELGDTPKHESGQWVINNYQKYLPMILEAEKEVLE